MAVCRQPLGFYIAGAPLGGEGDPDRLPLALPMRRDEHSRLYNLWMIILSRALQCRFLRLLLRIPFLFLHSFSFLFLEALRKVAPLIVSLTSLTLPAYQP